MIDSRHIRTTAVYPIEDRAKETTFLSDLVKHQEQVTASLNAGYEIQLEFMQETPIATATGGMIYMSRYSLLTKEVSE